MSSKIDLPVRNELIDIAKGIGIILVVAGHNYLLYWQFKTLVSWIYSFHMPLFFLLSGIFIKSDSRFKDFFFGRCDGIIKPYISGTIFISLAYFSYTSADLQFRIFGILYGSDMSLGAYAYPLWFLPSLFISSLFCWAIIRATNRATIGYPSKLLLSIALLIAGVVFMQQNNPAHTTAAPVLHPTWQQLFTHGAPWSLDLLPITSSYILLGYFFKNAILGFSWNKLFFIVASATSIALFQFFPGTLDLAQRHYDGIILTTAKTFLGLYLVFCFSSIACSAPFVAKILALFGQRSITILIFHAAIEGPLCRYLADTHLSWKKSGLIALIATLVLSMILHELIVRVRILSMLLLPKKKLIPQKNMTPSTVGATS